MRTFDGAAAEGGRCERHRRTRRRAGRGTRGCRRCGRADRTGRAPIPQMRNCRRTMTRKAAARTRRRRPRRWSPVCSASRGICNTRRSSPSRGWCYGARRPTARLRCPAPTRSRLTVDGQVQTQPFAIEEDIRCRTVERRRPERAVRSGEPIRDKVNEANNAIIQIRQIKQQLNDRLKRTTAPTRRRSPSSSPAS